MNIKEIIKNIDVNKVMKVIALNEISNNQNFIYKFSYAGGRSGYSFGRSQFDVKNNDSAKKFLQEKCDFSDSDINRLLQLDKDVLDLNGKLSEHKKEIDELDLQHIKSMINHVVRLEGLPEMNEKVFIHLVDYHNQFNLAINGKMHKYLKTLKIATSENILKFKLKTKWGIEHPTDVNRRYNNIEKNY